VDNEVATQVIQVINLSTQAEEYNVMSECILEQKLLINK
jgi:Arc/MetJ family transcription regulator